MNSDLGNDFMYFLDKLSSIVSVKVDLSKFKSFHVKLIGDKNTVGFINVTKNEIQLNVNSNEIKDPLVRKQVLDLIRDEVHVQGQPILEAKASEVVQSVATTKPDAELLNYFRNKIPEEDIAILRAALTVRNLFNKSQPVDNYLSDIRYKYGQHGANIANLCSADYFESQIKPMYEELSKRPNFTPEMFLGNYQILVDSAPFAVFVSRTDSVQELLLQVIQKLEFNKMYGLKKLNIHGIGHENVKKIEELVEHKSLNTFYTDQPSVLIEGNVINVTIFY